LKGEHGDDHRAPPFTEGVCDVSHREGGRSPGVLSGNVIQIPVNIPVNLCGNTIDVVGILNPAFGNTCVNAGGEEHKSDSKDDGKSGHKHHENGGYGG
jgi:hypothetical protein